ncbi:MAG TPA: signal peptidase II [Caulobacteraceae bacterium]|jgi:signal peptidase II|nr:signal peptidase II [Caulobacteraceae bacterium]
MTRVPRLAAIAYGLALVVIVSDQALKYWVLDVFRLPERFSAPVAGPLWLTMVWNKGVSFGVMNFDEGWTRWPLSAFSLIVACALMVWAWRVEKLALALAVGLIIGGAVGNAIDRVRLGAVTDFIDVRRLWFPWVFNLADSAISVGSVLLIWDLFLAPRKKEVAPS